MTHLELSLFVAGPEFVARPTISTRNADQPKTKGKNLLPLAPATALYNTYVSCGD